MVPSHSHVSPSRVPSPIPPKRTVRPRAASKAIACPERPLGEAAGVSRVQTNPSHSQVSLDIEVLFVPPKRTIEPRLVSVLVRVVKLENGPKRGVEIVRARPA